jgi:hypothetical protein
MHYDIECYYNECPNENNSIEYEYFNEFHKGVSQFETLQNRMDSIS